MCKLSWVFTNMKLCPTHVRTSWVWVWTLQNVGNKPWGSWPHIYCKHVNFADWGRKMITEFCVTRLNVERTVKLQTNSNSINLSVAHHSYGGTRRAGVFEDVGWEPQNNDTSGIIKLSLLRWENTTTELHHTHLTYKKHTTDKEHGLFRQ